MAAKKAAAPKRNPQVVQARQQGRQTALAGGASKKQARQAGQQAGAAKRQSINSPMPQPPAPIDPNMGQGGYYQYSPTQESQTNQPYQDMLAQGAMGALPSMFQRYGQQGQLGDIYGQNAGQYLGGAQNSMGPLANLGNQGTGLGAGTMGQYGQLMGNNVPIQQNIANEIQGIQAGNLDVDPAQVQQLNQQEQLLNEQLRRQLGPDYATSSAGIEALGRFQQGKNTSLATANYNRLQGLVGMQQGGLQNLTNQGINYGQFGGNVQGQQFGQGAQMGQMFGQNAMDLFNQGQGMRNNQIAGAGQLLGQAGQIQGLYGNVPQQMGQFGQAMSGQGAATIGATGPYQQDRFGKFQQSFTPTKGMYTGQTLVNQGNTLISAAGSMGGGGGPSAPQASDTAGSGQMMTPSSGGSTGGGWPMGGYG